jgi:hypothetical protein
MEPMVSLSMIHSIIINSALLYLYNYDSNYSDILTYVTHLLMTIYSTYYYHLSGNSLLHYCYYLMSLLISSILSQYPPIIIHYATANPYLHTYSSYLFNYYSVIHSFLIIAIAIHHPEYN